MFINVSKRTPSNHRVTNRTFYLAYILERLLVVMVGGQPAADCAGFDEVPLPCPRLLWDYHSSEAWAYRLDRCMQEGLSTRKLTICHVQTVGGSGVGRRVDEQLVRDMASWCEGADELGTLLWMIATMD